MVGDWWDSWTNEGGTDPWLEPCMDDFFNCHIAKYAGWKVSAKMIIFSWLSKSDSVIR
jgi:hypothetical protein